MKQSEIDKILELYKMGVPKTKIAKELNCSTPTVLKYIRQTELPLKIDPMIGKSFGLLTVLERAPKRDDLSSRCIRYKCKCQCGNITEVDGNALRTNHTTSCGCTRKNSAPYTDLTNQRFGKLTVLYIVGSDNDHHKIWHCKCDCGKECDVSSKCLLGGHTKSCGCLRSWKENEIKELLTNNNVIFKQQYTFSDLRGKRNPLKFDFAILDINDKLLCLIEYQGQQHYDVTSSWHTKELEQFDTMKKEYCNKNNIPLYELNSIDNIEERINQIIKLYGY